MQVCHAARTGCKFAELKKKIDCHPGKKLKDGLKFLKSSDAAVIDMVLGEPVCVESFSEYRLLSRFAVCDMSQTVVAVDVMKAVDRKAAGAADIVKASEGKRRMFCGLFGFFMCGSFKLLVFFKISTF